MILALEGGRVIRAAAVGVEEASSVMAGHHTAAAEPHLLQPRLAALSIHAGMAMPLKEVFTRMSSGPRPTNVVVVGNSILMNEAVLQSAAEKLLGNDAKFFIVPFVPSVDLRDRLPLTEIMDADFVVTTDPPPSGRGLRARA